MELGRWLKHAHAISIIMLLHFNASLSLGSRHYNANMTTRSSRCIEKERDALLAIKVELDEDHLRISSWGSRAKNHQEVDCCRWKGVYCDPLTGHVIQLHLRGLKDLSSQAYEEDEYTATGDVASVSSQAFAGKLSSKLVELHHLEYLDLRDNFFNGSQIPSLICSLSNLRHLDLHSNDLSGSKIPKLIRNLTNLRYLDLSDTTVFRAEFPYHELGNLTHLEYLNLGGSYFPYPLENLNWLTGLSSLKYLDLSSDNFFNASQKPSLSCLNHLAEPFPNLTNSLSLKELHLSGNQFSGIIPASIGKLPSLEVLDLAKNDFCGMIPETIGQLLSLKVLCLSRNRLSGRIPNGIGKLPLLKSLLLSENELSGNIPKWIGKMSSLQDLNLSGNKLRGRIPQSIGQLSNLTTLNLSTNSLKGVTSEIHFSTLSVLEDLDLSSNSLDFNVTCDWIPPFQLFTLNLRKCKLGPSFPKWLRTQKHCFYLDISHAGISDVLPSWFWGLMGNLFLIDISHNQIGGTFDNSTSSIVSSSDINLLEVHFASNQLEGPIPAFLSHVSYLDLSSNRFSDMTSFICGAPKIKYIVFLNLSSNHLSGEIPDCWRHLDNLILLDLSSNAFSGEIPTSLGSLLQMETLKLRRNKLVGELPSSLKNCTSLRVIDLGDNMLSKSVPQWLGISFPKLVILMFGSNRFSGSLPSRLCHLKHIQIFDFSLNEISGTIPKCLNNLTSLAEEGNSSPTIQHRLGYFSSFLPLTGAYYDDDASFIWKGRMSAYKSTLGLVKRIDLSSNRLTGKIPDEITQLVGLVSLNLSRNHLTGDITSGIGNLQSLDYLDLSQNQIDGDIPTSLARIDRLSLLDLSDNNLSGEIPTGTQLQGFDPSCFSGNPRLCGLPLRKCASSKKSLNVSHGEEDGDELITQGFYISMGLGFVVGFWGVCGSLIFKRSWRYAHYKFLNDSNDWLYLRMALIRRKLKELLSRRP